MDDDNDDDDAYDCAPSHLRVLMPPPAVTSPGPFRCLADVFEGDALMQLSRAELKQAEASWLSAAVAAARCTSPALQRGSRPTFHRCSGAWWSTCPPSAS